MKRCPYCAEEIQDEAIVCRYCGRDMNPSTGPIASKTNTRLNARRSPLVVGLTAAAVAFVAIGLVGWFLYTQLFSGPPDRYLIKNMEQFELSNIVIISKTRCNVVSAPAKAIGVDEAWLVGFSYDSPVSWVGHIANRVESFVKVNGEWHDAAEYGLPFSDCP